jgi:hypothetical protein
LPQSRRLQKTIRWVKKWALKIDERLLAKSISNRLWVKDSQAQ